MGSYLNDAQRLVGYLARLAGQLSVSERNQFLADSKKMQQAGMDYRKRLAAKLTGTDLSPSDVSILATKLQKEYQQTNDIMQALVTMQAFCRETY